MSSFRFTTIMMGSFKRLPSMVLSWDTPLPEVVPAFGKRRLSCVVLKKESEIIGLIDKNILIEALGDNQLDLSQVDTLDISRTTFVTTTPETTLFDFLEKYQHTNFSHILVVSPSSVSVLRSRVVRKLKQIKDEQLHEVPINTQSVRKVSMTDSLVESLRLLTNSKIEYLVLDDHPNKVITRGMISEIISSQDNVWEMKIADMPTLNTPVTSRDYPTFKILKEAENGLCPYIAYYSENEVNPNIARINTLHDHLAEQLDEMMTESVVRANTECHTPLLDAAVDEVFGIGVAVFSPKLDLAHFNNTFKELLNVDQAAFSTEEIDKLSEVHDIFKPIREASRKLSKTRPTLTLKNISGLPATCIPQLSGIWNKQDLQGYILSLNTDGDIKTVKSQWEKMAYFDALTKLPNRVLLMDKISVAIKRCARNGTKFAILFVDLDGFKDVNDYYGHRFGDQVLQEVAHRFMGIMRESDTIGRLGGDEFLFILPEVENEKDANTVIYRALECLTKPFILGEDHIHLGCSIGMALYPTHAETVDELISYADKKMYENKNKNKHDHS